MLRLPKAAIEGNYWLEFVSARLAEGFVFIIHAGNAVAVEPSPRGAAGRAATGRHNDV